MSPEFQKALPPHVSVDKFIRTLVTAVQNNESLLRADRKSLYSAAMKAAADGLLPDGKEAALVQFKDSVSYMPMTAGILKKVRNSGELSSITAQIVHKNDRFKYWVDADGEHLEHEPNFFSDRGPAIGVYALAKTKDGAVYIEVLTEQQVSAIRSVSRSKDSGPWAGPFADEMKKKSAIRRLSKRLPMSSDLSMTIERDDELYDLEQKPEVEAPAAEQPPKKSRLASVVEAVETTSATVPDDEVPL
jgi:recombination protein RecT